MPRFNVGQLRQGFKMGIDLNELDVTSPAFDSTAARRFANAGIDVKGILATAAPIDIPREGINAPAPFGPRGAPKQQPASPQVSAPRQTSNRNVRQSSSSSSQQSSSPQALPPAVPAARESQFLGSLVDSILNPSFAPDTASENALVNELLSLTNAGNAVRGLGPSTSEDLSRAIAPTLVDQRNTDINNLLSAFGAESGNILAERGQNVTQRGQTIQGQDNISQLEALLRGQNINERLGLGQLSLTQRAQDLGQFQFLFNSSRGVLG